MKNFSLFILCLSAFSISYSQNLEGTWQLNTPLFANYESSYEFESDGSFTYYPECYNTLQIIYALKGTYSLQKDSILFTVNEVVVNSVDLENLKIDRINKVTRRKEHFWVKDGFDNIEGMVRDFPSTSNFWKISYYQKESIKVTPKTFAAFFSYNIDDEMHLILDGHKFDYKYIKIDEDLYYYIYGAADIDD